MLISAFLLTTVALCYIIFFRRNKYIRIIGLYFFTIAALLIVSVLYSSKTSTYTFPMQTDRNIYFFFSRISVHINDLSRIYNLCIGGFMISSLLSYSIIAKSGLLKKLLLTVPVLIFLILNDPGFGLLMYISINSEGAELLEPVTTLFRILSNVIIAFYILLPVFVLIKFIRETKIQFKKKYGVLFLVCLIAIDIFFLLTITVFFGNIGLNNVDLLRFPKETDGFAIHFILFPFIAFSVIFLIIFITMYYKPFFYYTIISKGEQLRSEKHLSKNMNLMLHLYKNAFISAERLSDVILEELSSMECSDTLISASTSLKALSREYQDKINNTLNKLKAINNGAAPYKPVNVCTCLSAALDKINKPDDICIRTVKEDGKYNIIGNQDQITEVFVNLLYNSIQSLESVAREKKCIEINLENEDKFIIISVTDNGSGIQKENLNKVFSLFYTSRLSGGGSGIGLSYVKSIVQAHHGSIEVKSIPDVYTTFSVILPIHIIKQ